jgi:hypothetical protein
MMRQYQKDMKKELNELRSKTITKKLLAMLPLHLSNLHPLCPFQATSEWVILVDTFAITATLSIIMISATLSIILIIATMIIVSTLWSDIAKLTVLVSMWASQMNRTSNMPILKGFKYEQETDEVLVCNGSDNRAG